MDLPENKLTGFFQENDQAKWRPINNHNITNFIEDDIKRITNDYTMPIGEGGFGQVYRGVLDDGSIVAVKKYIYQNFKQGFAREVTVHCQINHKNVVRLLGYCAEENALTMVTEFISRGNLETLLHECDDPISLDMRLNIAVECSEALTYMHSMMYQPIIHGDIKPANILLDNNFAAKISDFGISRFLSMDKTQYTANVIGSRGYVDPEFLESGHVDPKNDVYSFGVVLVELITRKRASEKGIITDLIRNFIQAFEKGKKVREMFDVEITNVSNMKILDEVGKLAAHCLRRNIKERPAMGDVLGSLRILAGTNSQQGQRKTGQWSLWGAQKISRESTTSFSSTSTMLKRTGIWDIFNRHAHNNFNRNGNPWVASRNIEILQAGPRRTGDLQEEQELVWQGKSSQFMVFGFEQLLEATNYFSEENKLGRGGFGDVYDVYKGQFPEGLEIAVKRVSSRSRQGFVELTNEVQVIAKLQHRNLVRLLGCCSQEEEKILVYEYLPNKSLDFFIFDEDRRTLLDWNKRIAIIEGIAHGLLYLHKHSQFRVIHRDIKPSNILLDCEMNPKISNFGLAKIFTSNNTEESTTNVVGTFGYMAPEYVCKGLFSIKSDVFSFGVVVLEILGGKRNFAGGHDSAEFINLLGYAWKLYEEERWSELIDASLDAIYHHSEEMMRCMNIALLCVQKKAADRPNMSDVVAMLSNKSMVLVKPKQPAYFAVCNNW